MRSPLGEEAAAGSPPGNNGTVKIESHGALDGIPQNVPHPGCTFVVEWYGFDEGDDVRSTVTFTMQAPTADVGLTVDGTNPVFVGGDPARDAGGELGLDGREAYTVSFSGAPHPQQGYHVSLKVSTPSSLGSTTKSKVFWVEDCVSEPDESPVIESPVIGLPVVGLPLQPAPPAGPTLVNPPSPIQVSQPGQGAMNGVTGMAAASPREVSAGQVAPTRVAAGLAGSRTPATQSALPTALGGLAALLAFLAWAVRRSAPRSPE